VIGFPKHLKTRNDYENCHQLALTGKLDKNIMKARWRNLIYTAKTWTFKSVVTEEYIPAENEKVMVDVNSQTGLKYTCFEHADNPNAEIVALAYTSTVAAKISELEAL
jgi:hypothetical protein